MLNNPSIHIDHNIEGYKALANQVSSVMEDALNGVGDRLFKKESASSQSSPSLKKGNYDTAIIDSPLGKTPH